ncbi:MAG: DUF5679 domain-containing protein [Actinobacteria bacterium]|nr:DUF5679 domain-containing protein [Actinomycetota bacterium]
MAETVQTTARCMKCKKDTPVMALEVEVNEKGRRQGRGLCPVCGTKVFKFLPKAS